MTSPDQFMEKAREIVAGKPWLADSVACHEAIAAALQAQDQEARKSERERIVKGLEWEADITPCAEDAMVTHSNARLVEADFSYEEAERLAILSERTD